jgi:hypothetical protein
MTTTVAAAAAPAVEAIGLTKVYGSGNTEVVAMKGVLPWVWRLAAP